jgi:hypothetical protein
MTENFILAQFGGSRNRVTDRRKVDAYERLLSVTGKMSQNS